MSGLYKKIGKRWKKIYIIDNKKSEKGQSESIKIGLKTLGKCDGYMFFSCDQPFLTSDTKKKYYKILKRKE